MSNTILIKNFVECNVKAGVAFKYAYIPIEQITDDSVFLLGKEIRIYTGEKLSDVWVCACPQYTETFQNDEKLKEAVDRASGKW